MFLQPYLTEENSFWISGQRSLTSDLTKIFSTITAASMTHTIFTKHPTGQTSQLFAKGSDAEDEEPDASSGPQKTTRKAAVTVNITRRRANIGQ